MKEFKIPVRSPEESRRAQAAMFKLGYCWFKDVTEYRHVDEHALFADAGGDILFGSESYFNSSAAAAMQEVTMAELELMAYGTASAPDALSENGATNPKAAVGNKSIPVTMLSPLACVVGALGKYNGKLKYGGANYIGTNVVMSVYLDAIRRHLDKIILGEEVDEVDGVPHFGAIMANCDIILSAQAAGTLIDDRLRSDGQLEAVKKLQPLVVSLQELHKEKNPKHYLMVNMTADKAGNK